MKILSLDGGGSKGIYTLGVLYELEAIIKEKENKTLAEYFDIIYGTSTGSIIASLIALNEYSITEIKKKYLEIIPEVMNCFTKGGRSKKLFTHADRVFGEKKFDSFKTKIAIVSTNMNNNSPLIFKNSPELSHSAQATFKSGFGLDIKDAIMASCAAYPFFKKVTLEIKNLKVTLLDGGYVANNPSVFALLDSQNITNNDNIKILSLGVGQYVEPKLTIIEKIKRKVIDMCLTENVISSNANVHAFILKKMLSSDNFIRIDNIYTNQKYSTNLLEKDSEKLEILFNLGRDSYSEYEDTIKTKFNI